MSAIAPKPIAQYRIMELSTTMIPPPIEFPPRIALYQPRIDMIRPVVIHDLFRLGDDLRLL
jgi:hypothetical protein